MPLFVNTNISSVNAQRQLLTSGLELDQASERLASGRRINTAADDAAGLAISNRQTSAIRGLNQAVRNANDGISLIQTAEGALSETTNILQRMRELAIQSANGVYEDKDRATLDAEVQQLVAELDRIATTTSFNGQNILDGTLGEVSLQVGSESNQTIDFSIEAVSADTLGMGSLNADVVGSTIGSTGTLLGLDEQDILINGQAIGAVSTSATMDEIVTQINENVIGVTASTVVEINGSGVGTGVVGSGGVTFTLTKGDGLTQTFTVANTESLDDFADEIVAQSGGVLSAAVNENGRLTVSAADARSLGVGAGNHGLTTTVQQAKIILTSDSGDEITVERGSTGTLQDLQNYGFRETEEGGVIEGVGLIASSGGANERLDIGDLTINSVDIDVTGTSSLAGKIDAINDVSDQTGVIAMAHSELIVSLEGALGSTYAANDTIEINGVTVDLALANSATASEVATAFNNNTDETGVSARVLGTAIVLESDQGAINLVTATTGSFIGTTTGIQNVTRNYVTTTGTFAESANTLATGNSLTGLAGLKLVSENGNPISVEFGDSVEQANLGILETNTLGEGAFGTAVNSISVDTASNAQKAIDVIDNALETVNNIRSELGAANNRLDFTISNLSNVSENTAAARSRIVDADFAAESAALSRAQVLQQASQAMLAQANARPQQVLQLLQ
ncbi:MAG: flagellin [Agarilytica sp.]